MNHYLITLILLLGVTSTASGQQRLTPLVDHHTHIASVNASALTVEAPMSIIEVPEELAVLLRNKEKWGGRKKDVAALRDLYTPDALVLDPVSPSWTHGERAFNYHSSSCPEGRNNLCEHRTFVIFSLLAQALTPLG